jgi:hypothetical protein
MWNGPGVPTGKEHLMALDGLEIGAGRGAWEGSTLEAS